MVWVKMTSKLSVEERVLWVKDLLQTCMKTKYYHSSENHQLNVVERCGDPCDPGSCVVW